MLRNISESRVSVPKKFYSLDALRGIAALAVVFWHWQHFFYSGMNKPDSFDRTMQPFYSLFGLFYEYGATAVSLFFSLSGFIFFWLYYDSIAKRKMTAWNFVVLRFSRLYPLHIVTLLFVLGLQQIVYIFTGDYFIYLADDVYLFILNIFFISAWPFGDGYSYNGPVWSVSVEIFLYILFFTVAYFTRRIRVRFLLGIAAVGLLIPASIIPHIGMGVFAFFLGGGSVSIV